LSFTRCTIISHSLLCVSNKRKLTSA